MRISFLHFILVLTLAEPGFAISVDDSPAEEGTWGFRPAVDAVSELNPPGFTWRPVEGAARYALEVASDAEFAQVVYSVTLTPWSAHAPSTTLPAGAPLHWRYAALDLEGSRSEWSIARTFRIAEDAAQVPRPTIEELVARAPKDHPRVFFRPEHIPKLKAQAEGELASRWAKIQESADNLLASPPPTAEPPLYPEGTERLSEEWKKIWWGNRLYTIDLADGAATLAFAYRITGDERYGKAARDLMVAFCEWDEQGSTEYQYNDEAAMAALKFPARAMDWAWPALSEDDRAKCIETMRERGRQCFEHLTKRKHLWKPYASHSNRAWHFLGEVALAFLHEIPEAPEWLDFAMNIYATCYPAWGDADGGWHEGVGYWQSYLTRFGYWILDIEAAFGINAFERPFFHKTGNYAMYMVPPGTLHGGYGDMASAKKIPYGAGTIMRILSSGSMNPQWAWYAEQVGVDLPETYYGFLWASRSVGLEPAPPTDWPSSTAFHGVGLAILNTNILDGTKNNQLFFKSSPLGTISHGYNANNSFHLNILGAPALINTGQRDVHGSPHHRNWMHETISQNAILVNGLGQIKQSPLAQGRILHFETSADLDVVVGEAGESYGNLRRWIRRVLFFKPDVIVIHDVLEAPEKSEFEWLAHTPTRFDLTERGLVWQDQGGERKVELEILHPAMLEVSQSDGYGEYPPHDWAKFDIHEWHFSANPVEKRKGQSFVTIIRINGANPQVRYMPTPDAPEEGLLVMQLGEKNATVTTTSRGASITLGDRVLAIP